MAGLSVSPDDLLGFAPQAPEGPEPEEQQEEQGQPQPRDVIYDEETGTPMYPQPDGTLIIGRKSGPRAAAAEGSGSFDANLAESIDQMKLNQLAQELLRGYQSDMQSRQEYIETLADGIPLLGLKIEPPTTGAGDASAPMEGMSTERSHLLLEAVVRGQSNAHAELLPASGPVKVVDDGAETEQRMIAAEDLEKAMNHYLKPGGIATEYYPDTDRLLWRAFYGGCCFRKVFHCPLRDRPVAESVSAENLIINWAATDISNAARVTHRSLMQNHLVKSMQRLEQWRDVNLQNPSAPQLTAMERAEASLEGKSEVPQLSEDYPHVILEMYVDRDLSDFGVANRGQKRGRPVPYRVVIEQQSQQILEIRRNWRESDKLFRKRKFFVKYSIIPGFGFYDYGMVHLLGNDTTALTAMLRMTLDAGMFASFPGFLYSSLMGRQDTSVFRVPPGGGQSIDTNGEPIGNVVMPLPYKDPSAALLQMMESIKSDGQRLGSISELPVGEGKQDAPVGTTIALIEQATKVVAAVHKRLHAAQAEEFMLLKDLFAEDPEALWRGLDKSPLMQDGFPPEAEYVVQALNDFQISPQADPNVPSHMHRIMLAMAIGQLADAHPALYDEMEAQKFILRTLGLGDGAPLLQQQPQQPGQDPQAAIQQAELGLKQQELQMKAQEMQGKALQIQMTGQQKMQALGATAQERTREDAMRLRELAIESQDRAADRESRERVANMHAAIDVRHQQQQTETEHAGMALDHIHKMTEPAPWAQRPQPSRGAGGLSARI